MRASVAQLEELLTCNQQVGGSKPSAGSNYTHWPSVSSVRAEGDGSTVCV